MSQPELHQDGVSVSSTGTTLPRYSVGSICRANDDAGDKVADPDKIEVNHDSTSPLPLSVSTTSRTREQLHEAEKELKELQDAMKAERAVNERLKHEGAATDASSAEFKRRIRQLERDVRGSNIKDSRRPTTGLFKAMCSTDLLFLIDTTASMMGHIHAAKDQVKSIVDAVLEAFFNEAEVRIAVVGYKDHQDKPNIQFLDFVKSADRVRSFLSDLKATGGGDLPEDVLGGIQQALNCSWRHPTKTIIHIADAPPHGTIFHSTPGIEDSFPIPGSEPHHLTIAPLLQQMIGLRINYALLHINSSTDRMALTIYDAYKAAGAQCSLLETNKYFAQTCDSSPDSRTLVQSSNGSAKGVLMFEETKLGTSYSALQHLVVKNVTASVSRTVSRLSASPARASKRGIDKKLADLGSINEDEDAGGRVSLEGVLPQWTSKEWFNEMLLVEGFAPNVVAHGSNTLNDMMSTDDDIEMATVDLTIRKRSKPFAQGAMRLAFYARTATSVNRFVVKSYKKNGKRLAHLAEDMRCQALCKAFALEFNAMSEEPRPIDFIVTTCFRDKRGRSSKNECMSLEPFLEGTYVKYNNNCGWINERTSNDQFHQAAQAFSHFTFERSRGRFLVSDLQGVGGLLTDPAIHTSDRERFRLADTNLGAEGFKFFFATHKCNSICHKLQLKSNGSMIRTGKYKFREDWPSTSATTLCCSNKLCGRIIHRDSSKTCERYPDYQWCAPCWVQLKNSTVTWICVAPGPHHEFEESRFFHESQGQSTPRKCTSHRGEQDIVNHKTSKISQTDLSKLFKNGTVRNKHDAIEEQDEDDDADSRIENAKAKVIHEVSPDRSTARTKQRAVFRSALKLFPCFS